MKLDKSKDDHGIWKTLQIVQWNCEGAGTLSLLPQ